MSAHAHTHPTKAEPRSRPDMGLLHARGLLAPGCHRFPHSERHSSAPSGSPWPELPEWLRWHLPLPGKGPGPPGRKGSRQWRRWGRRPWHSGVRVTGPHPAGGALPLAGICPGRAPPVMCEMAGQVFLLAVLLGGCAYQGESGGIKRLLCCILWHKFSSSLGPQCLPLKKESPAGKNVTIPHLSGLPSPSL